MVGVACLPPCKRTSSGESLLMGSRKRRRSQPIHRGPSSTATAKLAAAASAARGVILAHAARRRRRSRMQKPEKHDQNDEAQNDGRRMRPVRHSSFVLRHFPCIPESPGRRYVAAPALSLGSTAKHPPTRPTQ